MCQDLGGDKPPRIPARFTARRLEPVGDARRRRLFSRLLSRADGDAGAADQDRDGVRAEEIARRVLLEPDEDAALAGIESRVDGGR